MIDIVKASAGSGKTYRLAKTYLQLLLQKEKYNQNYRHILAVTFTNKATEEMKKRIIQGLAILAKEPQKSNYCKDFTKLLGSEAKLQEKAKQVLYNLLHDYSAFNVSTIDKFFQMTLKAFARELGYFASYHIELDKKPLLSETVDRILDGIDLDEGQGGKDKYNLLDWLSKDVINNLKEGKRFNLRQNLLEFAQKIQKDDYRIALETAGLSETDYYTKYCSQEKLERFL